MERELTGRPVTAAGFERATSRLSVLLRIVHVVSEFADPGFDAFRALVRVSCGQHATHRRKAVTGRRVVASVRPRTRGAAAAQPPSPPRSPPAAERPPQAFNSESDRLPGGRR